MRRSDKMSDEQRQLSGDMQQVVRDRLGQPVRLTVAGSDPAWRHQIAAIALADLLGRFCTDLTIAGDPAAPAHPALPPGPALLLERLHDAAANGGIASRAQDGLTAVVSVAIAAGDGADIYVDGSGWISYVGTEPGSALPDENTVVIGPLSAACRAASRVHQRLLDDLHVARPQEPRSWWSALTLQALDAAPDDVGPSLQQSFVDALLMGAGSIGGAAVYTVARTPRLAGRLDVIDPETLEARNALKALVARQADVTAGASKAQVAARELAHLPALAVNGETGTLAQWVAARPAERPLPLVLCAVDSIAARRELQDHGPLDVLNAACGDLDVTVSSHRTDDGPCIYCLHIETVLDSEATQVRILARETGIHDRMVAELLTRSVPLNATHLRGIEQHRGEPPGALSHWQGQTLDVLYRERILYGEARVRSGDASAAVVAPYVTALAGVLLASELLKRTGDAELRATALGPSGLAIKYEESLAHGSAGMLTNPPRWPTSECLCRSTRRLALLRDRYGL
jgi:molybdopterin/thiamine biosynthesis adenylyltransferase